MQSFLERHWAEPEVQEDINGLRCHYLDAEKDVTNAPQRKMWREDSEIALQNSVLSYVQSLMDRDSKSTPLKSLQGKIWREGYATGKLKSEIYPDVHPAFVRWSEQGKTLSIFSSGSVLAQQLLFRNTWSGDLTFFLANYFDTTTGPKREPESYRKIALALNLPEQDVLFVSDTLEEMDAARKAGMETAWCVRQDKLLLPATSHRLIRTFNELVFS